MSEYSIEDLYNHDAFFKLPVVDHLDGPFMSPIMFRDQPTAFMDDEGSWWSLAITDNGLARQLI